MTTEQITDGNPNPEKGTPKINNVAAKSLAKYSKKIEELNFGNNTQQEEATEGITVETITVDESEETKKEINAILVETFREVLRSPHSNSSNIVSFAQVVLKNRIINSGNVSPEMVKKTIGRFRGIWDSFDLNNHDSMLFLNDAINGEVDVLEDINHEVEVSKKALDFLSKNYPEANHRNTFGGGRLSK